MSMVTEEKQTEHGDTVVFPEINCLKSQSTWLIRLEPAYGQ